MAKPLSFYDRIVLWPTDPVQVNRCQLKFHLKNMEKQLTMVDGFGIIIKLSHERHRNIKSDLIKFKNGVDK